MVDEQAAALRPACGPGCLGTGLTATRPRPRGYCWLPGRSRRGCCAPACCQEVSPRCPVFVNGASAPRRDGRWGREVSGCSTRGHTAASGAAPATWPRRPRARSGGAREAALGPQSPARRELGSGTAGLLLEPLDAGTAEPWGAASRDRLSAAWHGGLLDLLPCVTQGLAHADSAHPGGRRCDTGCRSLCRA